jgi:type IV pilus assembly protein PilB
MNNELRELAFNRAPTSQLRKAAIASGMRTLREDGVLKVLKGVTTAEEVLRVAQAEGVASEVDDDE